MRISWRFSCLALLAAGSLLSAGCGGISASKTISPLDFLLPGIGPGILRADPAQTNAPAVLTGNSFQVACAR